MLPSQHAHQKKQNRECLLKIISNLKFLARQGLPLRGDGSEADSNFMQLMKLYAKDDPQLAEWLDKKTNKYVSHDIQNELLRVMALSVLREIAHSIHESPFFSVMCDECVDVSNKEQLAICIRWISNADLEVHEDVVGQAVRGEDTKETLALVCDFYGEDFNRSQLQLHLDTLKTTFPEDLKSPTLSVHDVKKNIQSMSVAERSLISEVVTLLQLILILPSTNAVSERTFSARRRLKTYLRATMNQERLNHLLLLHVHKELTDKLSCIDVASSFVADSEHRLSVFGRFI